MANRANEYPNEVLCPLVDEIIDCGDCIENQDVARGGINEASMPAKFKQKLDWKDICLHCKYHEYS